MYQQPKENLPTKYRVFLLICLAILVSGLSQCSPYNEQKGMDMEIEYQKTIEMLGAFETSKDLAGLERTIKEIEKTWGENPNSDYFNLILRACDVLSSVDFRNRKKQVELERRYATLALTKTDAISIEVEVKLLLHLQDFSSDNNAMGQSARSQLRAERAKLWLRAWGKIERTFDEDFDFGNYPEINVMPPSSAGLPAGASPEHITDPQLRAEYEAAIAENKNKIDTYRQQDSLRKIRQWFLPKAKQYLIRIYSTPPADLNELESYLELYEIDEQDKFEILDAVRRNTSN